MGLCHRPRRKPTAFRQTTGRTVAEFDRLRDDVAAGAAGRKPKPGPDDRLLPVLMYYRVYVPQAVLGGRFGVDAGTACRIIHATGLALAGVFRIPERKVRLGPDELAEAFVDATERPTNRPQRGQRRYDSGKKKRHAVEHRVVVAR